MINNEPIIQQTALTTHTVATRLYQVEYTQQGEDTYIKIPVVMMVEGVHYGSRGPLLHTADRLRQSVDKWPGTPVTIDHPQEGGQYVSAQKPSQINNAVGYINETWMDGEKLKAYAYLHEQKLIAASPEAHQHIKDGQPLDVSIGVFSDEVPVQGEHEGENYEAVAINHVPDHLALLPGGVGACSWQDGCGVRVNKQKQKGGETELNELKIDNTRFGIHALQLNESLMARMDKIREKLYANDSEASQRYVVDVWEDHVIYEHQTPEGSQLYRQPYEVEGEEVNFVGDAQKVKREVRYLATNEKPEEDPETSGDQLQQTATMKRTKTINNEKGGSMSDQKSACFVRKVDSLIANESTAFTEGDREWLMAQEDARLDKLEPKEQEAPEVNADQAREMVVNSIEKPEDLIALAPDAYKEQFQDGLRLYKERREGLIQKIQTNTAEGTWEKDELEKMDTAMLEKLSKSIPAPVDYSANGSPAEKPKEGQEDVILPLSVQRAQKQSK